MRRTRWQNFRVMIIVVLAAATSGCGAEEPYAYRPYDEEYRARHPLDVRKGTAEYTVEFLDGRSDLPSGSVRELSAYLAEYLRYGVQHGPISMVMAPGISEMVHRAREEKFEELFLAAGVRRQDIRVRVADSTMKPDRAVLSYVAYGVKIPVCPDWTRDNLLNYRTPMPSNFGCADQANIGRMVSDPADLLHQRKATSVDASSIGRVINQHRAGQPTNSADNRAGPNQVRGSTQ